MIPVFSVAGGRTGVITRVRFSPAQEEHRAMCIESGGALTLVDLEALKYATSNWQADVADPFSKITNHPLDFAFSADGRIAFVADSGGRVTLDAVNDVGNRLSKVHKHLVAIDNAHDGGVFAVVPSPTYEFLLYTGGGDGMIRVWDVRYMAKANPMTQHMLGGAAKRSRHPAASKPVQEMWAHKNAVSAICFPDDKLLMSAGVDENIRLWDTAHNAVISTVRSYGYALGVWDVVFNRPLGRAVVVGQTTDVWAFYPSSFMGQRAPDSNDMVKIEVDDDDNNDMGTFGRWRRVCTYGTNVVVPTLNSESGAKALIVDVKTGTEVRRVETDVVDRIHSVDMHPKRDCGLMLTGATKDGNAVATVWLEHEPDGTG
ncbi:WD40-repeat-containing domain protein [Babesia caballi]|uniref:WD40-repeat-containing domain protein n=1 Tax=Babesia caballi TaxID=5871 RepID=A0AAV4LXB3_BABCB|nr:WD40-repeat-containing domain protein [Babesia caballi]